MKLNPPPIAIALAITVATVVSVGMPNCAPGLVLTAQTLPANLGATWNKNPAAENVIRYVLRLDGVDLPAVPVTTTSCPTAGTTCSARFDVPAFGAHSVTVRASNLKLSGDPTSFQDGPASVPVTFTLNQAPQAATAGLQVTQ